MSLEAFNELMEVLNDVQIKTVDINGNYKCFHKVMEDLQLKWSCLSEYQRNQIVGLTIALTFEEIMAHQMNTDQMLRL